VTDQVPTPAPQGDTPVPDAPKPPDGLDVKYWDATGGKVNQDALLKDFQELSGFKKAADEAKAGLPKDPTGYKLEFKPPKDFKLPEGTPEIKIDPKDPRIPVLLDFAVRRGLPQEAVDDLVSQTMIAEHAAYQQWDASEKTRIAEEHKKLGENADARKAAVQTFLTGWDKNHAAALMEVATDAATFQALEALIARGATTQIPGGGSLPEAPKPAQKSLADRMWPGMSGTERKAV